MTGRIPWERYDGDTVEAVAAICLLREHPHGVRRMPSQGDHGIDILVRHDDGSWTVYQVKRYTARLNATHKAAITKSWNRLRDHVANTGVSLREWFVVRPRDPSAQDDVWLEELTANSGVRVQWLGLANFDAWATKFPEVIDYYLYGGKTEAMEYALRALSATHMLAVNAENNELSQHNVEMGLMAMYANVNKKDPHYRYEYAVTRADGNNDLVQLARQDGLVWAQDVEQDGVRVRTFAYSRYDLAAEDSPLQFDVHLRPQSEGQSESLEGFFNYGLPIESMPGEVRGTLPGLEASGQEIVEISFLPSQSASSSSGTYDLFIDVTGLDQVSVEVQMSPVATGKMGWSWSGRVGPEVGFVIFGDHDGSNTSFSVATFNVEGMAPHKAYAALLLHQLTYCAGSLEIKVPRGPVAVAIATSGSEATPPVESAAMRVIKALMRLQRVIPSALKVPSLDSTSPEDISMWLRAGVLLSGRPHRADWVKVDITPAPDTEYGEALEFIVTSKATVRIEGREWAYG
jgi:hypothetical protein